MQKIHAGILHVGKKWIICREVVHKAYKAGQKLIKLNFNRMEW